MIFVDATDTGRGSRRAGLLGLLDAIRSGRISTAVVFRMNRLFRKAYKSLQFVHDEIVERNFRCVFVADGIDTDSRDNWRQLLNSHGLAPK